MLVIGIAQFRTQGFSETERIFQLAFEVVFALFKIDAGSFARSVRGNTVIIFQSVNGDTGKPRIAYQGNACRTADCMSGGVGDGAFGILNNSQCRICRLSGVNVNG